MDIAPIFAKDDPDDELFPCGDDDCEALVHLAGPDGFVRHMLGYHPWHPMTRAIFAALVEVQLVRAEDAAGVVR